MGRTGLVAQGLPLLMIAGGQAEVDTTPDPRHGKLIKQPRTIIVDIDLDRKPARLAMLDGGRNLSPRDMVCTSSGGSKNFGSI